MSILPACHTGVALDDVCVLSLGLLLRVLCAGVSLACRPGGGGPPATPAAVSRAPALRLQSGAPAPRRRPARGTTAPTGRPELLPHVPLRGHVTAWQRGSASPGSGTESHVTDRTCRKGGLPSPVPSSAGEKQAAAGPSPKRRGPHKNRGPGGRDRRPPARRSPWWGICSGSRVSSWSPVWGLGLGPPKTTERQRWGCRDLGVAESSP